VTNAHVVSGCRTLRVLLGETSAPARLLAADDKTDLAVLRTELRTAQIAALRSGPALRLGESVVSFGSPLSGALSKEGNLTTGNVSALAGLRDDPTYLQMTAPVQPGNSGGPLLDGSANVIGVVAAKLDAVAIAKRTGDIPQNVNFAIRADVLRAFLIRYRIDYDERASDATLAVADIADLAKAFTVQVECRPGAGPGPELQAPRPAPPQPQAQPILPPEPEPEASATAPAPVRSDPERERQVEQVQLVSVRTPYPGSAPETRELTIVNRAQRSVYKVSIGWLDRPLERCPAARAAYSGQRDVFVSLKPGEQSKTLGNFPTSARLFCVVDAAFLDPPRRREEAIAAPPEPQAPAPAAAPAAPAAPEAAPPPDQPAPPGRR
jgi:hypothetical protein